MESLISETDKVSGVNYNKNHYQKYKDYYNKYYKKYRILNKDKVKQVSKKRYKYYKEYYNKNKKYIAKRRLDHVFKKLSKVNNCRYKKDNDKITAFDLWKIAKYQKLKCALTGEKLTIHNISTDHIIPKSKGGRNIPSNIRLTLHNVNVARMNMTDEEFMSMCKKVVDYYK
jgi:5-methylcytosine-specific restriction endonuclease McrA